MTCLDLQSAIPNAQTTLHDRWWVEARCRSERLLSGGRVDCGLLQLECCWVQRGGSGSACTRPERTLYMHVSLPTVSQSYHQRLRAVPACVACGSQYVEPTLSGRPRGGLHDVGQEHHILTRSEVIDVHRGSLRPGPGWCSESDFV